MNIVSVVLAVAMGLVGMTEVTGTVSVATRGFPSAVILESSNGPSNEVSGQPVTINQINKSFSPGVTVVQVGQVVEFKNGESLLHNVHLINLDTGDTIFNIAMPVIGMVHRFTPEAPGVYAVLCDVHPEMEAYIIATLSPYSTIATEDGNFQIADVPAGSYTLKVWNVRDSRSSVEALEVR